jgi:CBS domain-containing protein
MRTLRDIMTPDVISVGPDTPLAEVAELLAAEGISGVPVVGATRVLGVVSASDILDAGASDAAADRERDGGAVWSAVEEEDDDAETPASPFFYDPWMDRRVRADDYEWTEEAADFGERTAGDVMTRMIYALAPDTPIDEAARFMIDRAIHRVLVIDGGTLVGIATSLDFVRVVAEQPAGVR